MSCAAAFPFFAAESRDRNTSTRNGWDARWFAYSRSGTPVMMAATPSESQVDHTRRPPPIREAASELRPTDEVSAPRVMGEMNVLHLRYADAAGDVVPALLCTPRDAKGPFPVVIAVHGLTSHKAQVCAQVGPELVKRGFAVLAPDMPRHGERPGEPRSVLDRSNPMQSFELFKQAVVDVRQLIDLAESRPDLDTTGGVTLVGFSMGSWVNSVVGPCDDRVRAMVLLVGGAHDIPPAALLLPQLAASDPRLAIAHFARKPLLMLAGRKDHIVTPEMVERLYAAAAEPKELVWYDSGHLLTPEAYDYAAEWVAKTVRGADSGAGK